MKQSQDYHTSVSSLMLFCFLSGRRSEGDASEFTSMEDM